jgi:hypothetical protein
MMSSFAKRCFKTEDAGNNLVKMESDSASETLVTPYQLMLSHHRRLDFSSAPLCGPKLSNSYVVLKNDTSVGYITVL